VTLAVLGLVFIAAPLHAANEKPNIVVIMGNDIGMWNIGAYHRGMMAGTTPNIDQLAVDFVDGEEVLILGVVFGKGF